MMTKWLRFFYSFQNIALAILLYVHLLNLSDLSQLTPLTFGVAMFFLVVIFILFMQVLSYPALPDKIIDMLALLLPTYIYVGIKFFLEPGTVYAFLTDLAFIETMTFVVAFLLLVLLGIFRGLKEKELSLIGASLAQILFLYPGMAAFVVFLSESTQPQVLPYLLIIGANLGITAKYLYKQSVLKG
jgi:hypothetical protein